MVVLSAAVLSRTRMLLSRQFQEMTRMRIEGLLGAFLKLVEHTGRDHTYIETETVRYVYQPMEELYLILITNKQSNIVEDLETLRLLAQVVQNACQLPVSEELLLSHAFDIIFAFDEVISFGYREAVTLGQIKTYIEMDSHEEKLQRMIQETKEKEEKERGRQIAVRLDKERARQKKEQKDRSKLGDSSSLLSAGPCLPAAAAAPIPQAYTGAVHPVVADLRAPAPKRGMQIGKKSSAPINLGGSVAAPLGVAATESSHGSSSAADDGPAAPVALNPLLDPVAINIEEKVSGSMQLEGGLYEMEIQGTFEVTVRDVAKADLAAFKIKSDDARFKFRLHPNLDKQKQSNENVLQLRDAGRAFRANVPAPLLKWRLQTAEEELVPVAISCWPSSLEGGLTQMMVELSVLRPGFALEDLHLQFLVPQETNYQIKSIHGGTTDHDGLTLHWRIPSMTLEDAAADLEFIAASPSNSLLPFTFEARSSSTLCPLHVVECFHQERGDPLKFELSTRTTYCFTVGG
eukprot:GHVT01073670.1.p1 GENE.GHVT01073670.1~~GHVT01073670.1.p1  ORF type:complete len:518 (+),score=134.79 GHVT01073670.1:891-2444(+)